MTRCIQIGDRTLDMSSSTPKPKVSWRHGLGNLYTREYFVLCRSPQDFNYPDFLLWSKRHKMDKIKVRREWSTARKYLARSRYQCLREAAVSLNEAWSSGLHAEHEKDFFAEQIVKQRLEKNRRKLHAVVDEVMSKRQRIEYESEKATLNKELLSGNHINSSRYPCL